MALDDVAFFLQVADHLACVYMILIYIYMLYVTYITYIIYIIYTIGRGSLYIYIYVVCYIHYIYYIHNIYYRSRITLLDTAQNLLAL